MTARRPRSTPTGTSGPTGTSPPAPPSRPFSPPGRNSGGKQAYRDLTNSLVGQSQRLHVEVQLELGRHARSPALIHSTPLLTCSLTVGWRWLTLARDGRSADF